MPISDPFVVLERYLQRGLAHLPRFIGRFFGHRKEKASLSPSWVVVLWGFIGSFGGIGILFAVFGHTKYFARRHIPPIVASYVSDGLMCA